MKYTNVLESPLQRTTTVIMTNRTSAPFPGIRICRMRRQRTNIFPDSSGMTREFGPPPMASRGIYRAIPWEGGIENQYGCTSKKIKNKSAASTYVCSRCRAAFFFFGVADLLFCAATSAILIVGRWVVTNNETWVVAQLKVTVHRYHSR
jgi:hypothetical protein